MFELSREEAENLIRTLDWVLTSTLPGEESRKKLEVIRDKISNVLKSMPATKRVKIEFQDEDDQI